MRKIIMILAIMLCCVVAKGQEYKWEIEKDENSEKICFIKGNLFKNHEDGYWTTEEGDKLIQKLIDESNYPIVIRDIYSNCYNDYSNIEESENNVFNEYYIYGYYILENNCYFLYKMRKYFVIIIQQNNGYDIKYSQEPLTEGYRSTEFINFNDGRKRRAILNGTENYLKGNIIFNF